MGAYIAIMYFTGRHWLLLEPSKLQSAHITHPGQSWICSNLVGPMRLPVNSSHGRLVTRSCRHAVNSSPVNSSHTRLVTQSTRHKRAHNKATSRNFLSARRSGSAQKRCSKRTA